MSPRSRRTGAADLVSLPASGTGGNSTSRPLRRGGGFRYLGRLHIARGEQPVIAIILGDILEFPPIAVAVAQMKALIAAAGAERRHLGDAVARLVLQRELV